MSLKEFSARCSAITLISAGAFGIAQAVEPPSSYAAPDNPAGIHSPAADTAITARVKTALNQNNIQGLRVQTEVGVVALAGTLPSEEVRQRVLHTVAAVDGVRGVDISALKINNKG